MCEVVSALGVLFVRWLVAQESGYQEATKELEQKSDPYELELGNDGGDFELGMITELVGCSRVVLTQGLGVYGGAAG